MNKPLHRSKLRIWGGRIYFTSKRHLYWYFSRIDFATHQSKNHLPEVIFEHKTLLLRKLKDVDMWLQKNKIKNLSLAIRHINGLFIEPGQTFSYWRQIGKPTAKKGYLEGMVLHNGTVTAGTGGGLCQLSNLIFWLTLHTPLTVTERWRHGYDVFPDVRRSQPFGSGATCAYPNIDLQIRNNTGQRFQLQLELTSTHLVGKWLSDKPIEVKYEIFEQDHQIKNEWWGGYSRNNKIMRMIVDRKSGREIGTELVAENHAIMMYSPLLESPDRPHHETLLFKKPGNPKILKNPG